MNTRRKGESWDAGPALPTTVGVLLVPVRPDDEARLALLVTRRANHLTVC